MRHLLETDNSSQSQLNLCAFYVIKGLTKTSTVFGLILRSGIRVPRFPFESRAEPQRRLSTVIHNADNITFLLLLSPNDTSKRFRSNPIVYFFDAAINDRHLRLTPLVVPITCPHRLLST
jgi:hypothetical protein